MLSQRGQIILGHSPLQLDVLARKGNIMRLNGIDAELLDCGQVMRLLPYLDYSAEARFPIWGGLLQRRAGTARHDAVAWGYARAADAQGVDVIENCEVQGFLIRNGRVFGVEQHAAAYWPGASVSPRAIILYETALGVGIALGPLVGGELGAISWRGPFFGVTVLMAIALIATLVLVEKTPRPAHRTSILDPLRALRHRGLLTMGLTALCYNWAFFTVLGYAPFPMNLDTHQLGYVFTVLGRAGGHLRRLRRPPAGAPPGRGQDAVPEPDPVRDRRAGHRARTRPTARC